VLLTTERFDQTLTVNPHLWAMFWVKMRGRPAAARRSSPTATVRLPGDLIVTALPVCYSLLGDRIDPATCQIIGSRSHDWEPRGACRAPPARHLHSHHNESYRDAPSSPIQDAGLQTTCRTLDLRFSRRRRHRTHPTSIRCSTAPSG